MPGTSILVYAFEEFIKPLEEELAYYNLKIEHRDERFFVIRGPVPELTWAQWMARDAVTQSIASIGDGAKFLRTLGKRWSCISSAEFRRSRLIQEQVCRDETKPMKFLAEMPTTAWGAWGLLDKNTLIAAPIASSPLPRGEITFQENSEPPSRAYLKLWEAMTLHGVRLRGDEKVMDLGSCPGGWTWVLASQAKEVVSVDKAPLDPKVAALKNVTYIKKDAFKLELADVGKVDWLFSDIICEPARLLELVQKWQAAGVQRFVCSIKYKGATDFEMTKKFLGIPGSRVVHLNANKHEVTWILV